MFSNDCLIEITFRYFYSFLLFLISRTTVQMIQVIIISLVYNSPITDLWVFSYHLCIVDFWHFCFRWSDQSSLILKLFPGCDWKLSVGHIQTGHTYFLTLCVHNCSLQLIALLDLKYPSSYSFKPYFYCLLVCIIFIGSEFIDPETCP